MREASEQAICRLVLVALIAVLILITTALVTSLGDAWAQGGPFGVGGQPASGMAGWLLAKQALFYRAMAGLIRAAKTNGSAYWGLMGISFAYGVFHAAGPGHGKAVISSYLLANEETWRRGIVLSFASAMLQALTAVVIVAVAAVLIGATAKMMGDTVRVIELVSYALIMLVGARLLWVKGRGFIHAVHEVGFKPETTLVAVALETPKQAVIVGDHLAGCRQGTPKTGAQPHHTHAHPHEHDEGGSLLPWGHAHGPQPQELTGPGGWWRGLSAIIAVGLRPCSGAILVLVFALAQGLFWAGVASTFVMGLGTAITVAAIASLAVAAKAAAARFANARAGYGVLVLRGIEVGAALLVTAFGALLLTGFMASERLVGF
jgi:nickel/cobalt exporter